MNAVGVALVADHEPRIVVGDRVGIGVVPGNNSDADSGGRIGEAVREAGFEVEAEYMAEYKAEYKAGAAHLRRG